MWFSLVKASAATVALLLVVACDSSGDETVTLESPVPTVPASTLTPAAPVAPTSTTDIVTSTPTPYHGDRYTQIPAGGNHTCALRLNGSVVCWGSDEWGQLRAPAAERFKAIAAGEVHTCGIRSNGTTVCWGYDPFAPFDDVPEETRPAPVFPPKDEQFTSITATVAATCGLRADGDAVCWEASWEGKGEYSPFGTEKVVDIAAGAAGFGVCGLRSDSSLVCWDVDRARNPPEGERFVSLSLGFAHGCGLRLDGSVFCWGDDSASQLPTAGEGPFSSMAAGTFHTCGLRSDGSVVCWGLDLERAAEAHPRGSGVNGRNLKFLFNTPRTDPPDGERFTAIAAGSFHTCGLRQDGGVSCWGYNHHGQASPPGDPG